LAGTKEVNLIISRSGIVLVLINPSSGDARVGERKMIKVRLMQKGDYPAVKQIVQSLTEWFDDRARNVSVPIDIRHQHGFIAMSGDDVVGFITLYVAEGKLNIGWMGVRSDLHRKGIGRLLLKHAEQVATEMGITQLATYTLGDRVAYEPYERTRQFYFRNGFRVYQRSQTDNPSCPDEIRIVKEIAEPLATGDADKLRA
jgi:GNAT superfamily N-acetyltransferase